MKTSNHLLAVYAYVDDVIMALQRLKGQAIAVETVYTPAPNEEIEHALGLKPSPVRRFVLVGGIIGVLSGFGLAVYTAAQWRFVVWGKPPIPRVPYVIISFEFCILFSILAGLAGLLMLTGMPRLRRPAHFDARFTVDRYGILLGCSDDRKAGIRELLLQNGAEEVRDV